MSTECRPVETDSSSKSKSQVLSESHELTGWYRFIARHHLMPRGHEYWDRVSCVVSFTPQLSQWLLLINLANYTIF